jgi:hypothetical protein
MSAARTVGGTRSAYCGAVSPDCDALRFVIEIGVRASARATSTAPLGSWRMERACLNRERGESMERRIATVIVGVLLTVTAASVSAQQAAQPDYLSVLPGIVFPERSLGTEGHGFTFRRCTATRSPSVSAWKST